MPKNYPDGTNSTKGSSSAPPKTILEALFAIWIIVVDLLYYSQFKALIISQLGHLLYRWH
jgi:hypothetical protein